MKWRINPASLPLLATIVVFVGLYSTASVRYDEFLSWAVFTNLLSDNAFLGITAVGMTLVILSGGIDLSVGALAGLVSIIMARLIDEQGIHPMLAMALLSAAGILFGATQGALVHAFALPPFLVTLAGMFFARGLARVVSLDTIGISHSFFTQLDDFSYEVFPVTALIFLGVLFAGLAMTRYTQFGRNVYAVGGSEQSARLMGLPVGRTKICVYAVSGFCSALAGIVYTLYTSSGTANAATMLELDAIAAAVIGGTLLSGGVGGMLGTLVGVLILGAVQTIITFEGTLNSWWARIVIGGLLLAFIVGQRYLHRRIAGK